MGREIRFRVVLESMDVIFGVTPKSSFPKIYILYFRGIVSCFANCIPLGGSFVVLWLLVFLPCVTGLVCSAVCERITLTRELREHVAGAPFGRQFEHEGLCEFYLYM